MSVVVVLYRAENRQLKASAEALRGRLGEALRRCGETEEQVTQQASLQGKMRERLQQMDSHAQHGSQQVNHPLSLVLVTLHPISRHST